MDEDEPRYGYGHVVLLAVAPVAVVAVIEHIIAPLIGHVVAKRDAAAQAPVRRKRTPRAALRSFGAYVDFRTTRP